jgi:hypothetical protein
MTESDYLCATNRVKVSAAAVLIRDVLPGDDWGIGDAEHGEILRLLYEAEEKLFASVNIEPEQ